MTYSIFIRHEVLSQLKISLGDKVKLNQMLDCGYSNVDITIDSNMDLLNLFQAGISHGVDIASRVYRDSTQAVPVSHI